MIYLDTACLVKLSYPEPDSAKVVAHIQGKTVCFTRLHELEFANALQLKIQSQARTRPSTKQLTGEQPRSYNV